jgi:hypothetical protein
MNSNGCQDSRYSHKRAALATAILPKRMSVDPTSHTPESSLGDRLAPEPIEREATGRRNTLQPRKLSEQ